ncbi:ABC transporter permease [Macrococcus sp. EM39E]|uniref:ABC transporter permease n=1 Tax=Macrococcus animalis TaxID=3395467 RepID=UPI0039BE8D05
MKSILYLVVKKQWMAYLTLLLTILLSCLTLYGIQQKMNAVFKMPIAVQDLDNTKASKQLIQSLSKDQFITIKQIDADDSFIEDSIKANVAVLSLSIPEGFEEKLNDQSLRDAITLYYRDDFVGTIAQEITSKSLYEAQIPYIVTYHINKNSNVELTKVKQKYRELTPTSHMKQYAIEKHSDSSISLSLIYSIILFVAMIQMIVHQRLKQNAALNRLYMFNQMKINLHLVFITIHTIIIMSSLLIIAQVMHQQMSMKFYMICFIFTLIYEYVLSLLLFEVNMKSHRLFMTVTFTIALITLYMLVVMGELL